MPREVKGIADSNLMADTRLIIEPSEEKRLLEQALNAGIGDESIGTFYVVVAAEIPTELNSKGYLLFSEEELRTEAEKHGGWFYDEDKRRLIGTIPSVTEIASKMRSK